MPGPHREAIGVDLGGTKIEVVVLDAGNAERCRIRVPTPAGDYDATLATIGSLVGRAERETGLNGLPVGVGTPGTLTAQARIKNANSTCLNGRALQHDLQQRLGRPVRIANDANCLALSEATDGAAAGAPVVFAAILGTGVGGGIVVHGRVLAGPNGLAGEWGHNPLPWAGADEQPRGCYCGAAGCIETWVSGPAMSADHERLQREHLAAAEIARRAAAGDAGCDATLARYESRLARALAGVVNLLDPDVVVLGGGLSRIDRLYRSLPALLPRHVFAGGVHDEPVRTRIVPARHGDSSGVRGAALLWRD